MDIAIVGAGAAGLAAARTLAGLGHRVVVFERNSSPGGRAATRRLQGCALDHGAQYLRLPAEYPALRDLILGELPREGLVDIGRPVWRFDRRNRVQPGDPAQNAEPKWIYAAGLDTLAERLAAGLDLRLNTPVGRLERLATGYRLFDEAGAPLDEAERVLVATPAPEATALLQAGAINPDRAARALALLRPAAYQPMITVLLGYRRPPADTVFADGSATDPRPYYALVNDDRGHDISWLAVENDKAPERAPEGVLALVVQMAVPFSERHGETPAQDLAAIADAQVRALLAVDLGAPLWHGVARWRYARPTGTLDPATLNRAHDGLCFAGDYAAGWRLHLALRSGLDAAALLTRDPRT